MERQINDIVSLKDISKLLDGGQHHTVSVQVAVAVVLGIPLSQEVLAVVAVSYEINAEYHSLRFGQEGRRILSVYSNLQVLFLQAGINQIAG